MVEKIVEKWRQKQVQKALLEVMAIYASNYHRCMHSFALRVLEVF